MLSETAILILEVGHTVGWVKSRGTRDNPPLTKAMVGYGAKRCASTHPPKNDQHPK